MEYLWLIPAVIIGITAVYLFLVFPRNKKHKDLELIRGKYIAHRGLHNAAGGVPENSLKSYVLAMKMGYAIEIDIHLTSDGEVVVFHDDTTKRICAEDLQVEKCTLAQLKTLRLSNTEEQIPTLREVLNLVDGKVPLLIEFKVVGGNQKALCEAADKLLGEYDGGYLVQSFYPQVLSWYRTNRKEVCRGQLASDFARQKKQGAAKVLVGWLLLNVIARPDFISYDHRYASNFSRRLCTSLGAMPVAWTLSSAAETARAKQEFDAYIFENYIPE